METRNFKRTKYKPIITILVISVALLFSNVMPVYAGKAIENLRYDERLLKDPYYSILVVSVLEINSKNTTNANPPKAKVKVDEILRLQTHRKGIKYLTESDAIDVVWRTRHKPSDHEGWNPKDKTNPPTGWHKSPFKKEWLARPLIGPDIGEKLIIFILERDAPSAIWGEVVQVYKFSSANKETVLQSATPADRTWKIQGSIAILIIILAGINLVFYVFLKKPFCSKQSGCLFQSAICIIPFLVLGLYILYESGISPYAAIRIDLLLIIPALVLTFLPWIFLFVSWFRNS